MADEKATAPTSVNTEENKQQEDGQKKSSAPIVILIFIVLLVILVGAFFLWKKFQQPIVEPEPAPVVNVTPPPAMPEPEPEPMVEVKKMTEDEARKLAEEHVVNMPQYKDNGGANLELIDTVTGSCSECWDFLFTFDVKSKDNPNKMDKAEVNVHIKNGKVTGADYTQVNKDVYDILSDLLNSLEQDGNVPFSVIKSSTFKWTLTDGKGTREVSIKGKQVKSNGITLHPEHVKKFFQGKGFRSDALNTDAGTMSTYGYKKGSLICLITDTLKSGNIHDMKVNCGELL